MINDGYNRRGQQKTHPTKSSELMDSTTTSTLGFSSVIQCAISATARFSPRISPFPHFWVPSTPNPSPLRTPNVSSTHPFHNGFLSWSSLSSSPDPTSSHRIAVLLEVDGVLIDAYQSGNRQAFNVAFRKLGLDCANWTEPIYSDLLRRGDGNEERMLALYFNRIGWPTSLPTSEKDSFMRTVLQEKRKALADFLMSKDTPLRPGVEKFIDDALDEGICVVILTASSKIGEETTRAIVEKLGPGRMSKLKFVGKEEKEQSFYGRLERSLEAQSGIDEELANEALKAAAAEKKRIADEVASILKLRVEINFGLAESVWEIIVELRAGADKAEIPVCNCVLVAGSQIAVAAAEMIGMPCIFLRSRLTSRAELRSTVSVMEGFGNAYLTVSKLRSKVSSSFGK